MAVERTGGQNAKRGRGLDDKFRPPQPGVLMDLAARVEAVAGRDQAAFFTKLLQSGTRKLQKCKIVVLGRCGTRPPRQILRHPHLNPTWSAGLQRGGRQDEPG